MQSPVTALQLSRPTTVSLTSIPTLDIDVCAYFPSLRVSVEFSFGLHRIIVESIAISHAARSEFY